MTPTSPASPNATDFRIYQYNNGMKEVCADPLTLQRRLTQLLEGAPDRIAQEAASDSNAIAFPAIEKILAATREVFDLMPLDAETGGGLIEEDVIARWNHFQEWMRKKKQSTDSSQKSSTSTAQNVSPFPMRNNLASGSTSPASALPGQPMLPAGHPSHIPPSR